MKRILAIATTLFLSSIALGQTSNLDSLIDVGNEQFESGEKNDALKTWQRIEESAPDTSSTYGTVLGNILYFYIDEKNEIKAKEYFNRIFNSKLNDKDKRYNKLGEPFKNYRYHAAMSLAGYYANQKKYETALNYVNLADNKIIYENTSLTAIKYQKVDLAFWKNRLYKDLGKPDSAFFVLVKRAFEYDYKNIYKNWATVSASKDELELAEAILGSDSSRKIVTQLKSELDIALNALVTKHFNDADYVSFNLRNLRYDIRIYEKPGRIDDCKKYLEQSFFYQYLVGKTK